MPGRQDARIDAYATEERESVWGVDKRQVRRFWISHVEVRILPPQPASDDFWIRSGEGERYEGVDIAEEYGIFSRWFL